MSGYRGWLSTECGPVRSIMCPYLERAFTTCFTPRLSDRSYTLYSSDLINRGGLKPDRITTGVKQIQS